MHAHGAGLHVRFHTIMLHASVQHSHVDDCNAHKKERHTNYLQQKVDTLGLNTCHFRQMKGNHRQEFTGTLCQERVDLCNHKAAKTPKATEHS